MSGLIESNIPFKDGEYYSSFDFEQWLRDSSNQMRMILTDFDGGVEEKAECNLTLDEWECLAHRILDAIEFQRKQVSK